MSTNNTEKKYLEFPKLSKQDLMNSNVTRFEPFYKELWFEANKRTPIATLRADVRALMAKADIDALRIGTYLLETEYAKVVSGAPLVWERRSVPLESVRMVLNFVLPLALAAVGFIFGWIGGAIATVLALALFKTLDESLTYAMDRAQDSVRNVHAQYTETLATMLNVPVEKITPALLAEMHKAFAPWRAKQLTRRAQHDAVMAKAGLAGGRRMGSISGSNAGSGRRHDADAGFDMPQGPAVNVNGMPMLPGTNIDVTGHVFGTQ